jgi:hypothetical protein
VFVLKSRNKPIAKKRNKVILAVKYRTNFRRDFVRNLTAGPAKGGDAAEPCSRIGRHLGVEWAQSPTANSRLDAAPE